MKNYSTWGVPWQPVVQPHLQVHHRQGRLGRHGVGHPHLELQHVRAEHLGADWIGLVFMAIKDKYFLNHFLNNFQLGSQDWMRHRERIYAARRRHVRDVCQKYEDPGRWKAKSLGGGQFWLDLNHGLAVCIHAKVETIS